MSSSAASELPTVFAYHVFCCFQQRPPGHPKGSCGAAGGIALWEALDMELQRRHLPEVSMVPTGCLGFCSAGPLMVVYPEGVWYRPRSEEDIKTIVERHFIGGEIVEELAVVLTY